MMKGNKKPHPYYSRRVVRREIARRLKAENEVAQLRAQIQQIRLTFSSAMGNMAKVDQSFDKLMSHYNE